MSTDVVGGVTIRDREAYDRRRKQGAPTLGDHGAQVLAASATEYQEAAEIRRGGSTVKLAIVHGLT
jgi:uncharacterized protein (DUF1330 family)